MSTRTYFLIVVLGVSLLMFGGYLQFREQLSRAFAATAQVNAQAPAETAKPAPVVSKEFEQAWAAIRAADKIKDPVQRCLQYPDPPGMHWSAKVVQAVCGRMAFQFISLEEMSKALDDRQAQKIDQAFQVYFDESASDPKKRGSLSLAYRASFQETGDKARSVADGWVAAAPASAFALTARGMVTLARAAEARGEESARDTLVSKFENMNELVDKARADFEAALRVNPRMIMAYSGLLQAGKLVGAYDAIESYAKAALAIDPADDRVYLDWMIASEPRWGGSMEKMEDIAQMASHQVDSNPYLQLTLEKPQGHVGKTLWIRRQYVASVEAYDRALHIAPSSTDFGNAGDVASAAGMPERAILYYSQATRFSRSAGGYFGRASMLFELRKPDLANEILREAGELNSRTSAELSEIAAAYWRGQQFEDAAKAFRVVLERRPLDHQVLLSLAQLYVAQLQQPEKAQPYIASLIENYPADARGWLLKSAGKSEAECHEALKKYLSLVDRNDPYETSMIAQAEARINVLETQGVGVHKQ